MKSADDRLYRLIYCSRSRLRAETREAELRKIIEVSQRNNARNNVTGALMLVSDAFAQILEGSRKDVSRTMDVIGRDPRHDDLKILRAETAAERRFANWTMGLVSDPRNPLPGASDLFERAFSGDADAAEGFDAIIRDWYRTREPHPTERRSPDGEPFPGERT
jgi:hypothetical protein